jgi:hypothetical protein
MNKDTAGSAQAAFLLKGKNTAAMALCILV